MQAVGHCWDKSSELEVAGVCQCVCLCVYMCVWAREAAGKAVLEE